MQSNNVVESLHTANSRCIRASIAPPMLPVTISNMQTLSFSIWQYNSPTLIGARQIEYFWNLKSTKPKMGILLQKTQLLEIF